MHGSHPPDAIDDCGGERRGQGEGDEEDPGVGRLGDPDVAHPARLGVERFGLDLGSAEQLDQHGATHVEALLHDHVHLAVEVVALHGERADALAHEAGRDEEDGQEDQRGQCDLPAEEEHRPEDDDHRHEVAHDIRQEIGEGLLGADHVVVQAADERSGLGPGEEGERHALDVAEDLGPHVVDEVLADVGRNAAFGQRQAGIRDGQDRHQDGEFDHQLGVVFGDPVVDEGPQDEGIDGADGRIDDDHRQEDGQDLAVGDGEREHPARRALLDAMLEDAAVLAKGAHATKPAAAPATSHPVSPHGHAVQPTVGVSPTWSLDAAETEGRRF